MKDCKELERAALDAHRAGHMWADYWRRWGPAAIALEPHDRQRFRRLTDRLLSLVVSGDGGPATCRDLFGDGAPEPWLADDAAKPAADLPPTPPPGLGSFRGGGQPGGPRFMAAPG